MAADDRATPDGQAPPPRDSGPSPHSTPPRPQPDAAQLLDFHLGISPPPGDPLSLDPRDGDGQADADAVALANAVSALQAASDAQGLLFSPSVTPPPLDDRAAPSAGEKRRGADEEGEGEEAPRKKTKLDDDDESASFPPPPPTPADSYPTPTSPCSVCSSHTSEPGNRLVQCDGCDTVYHQKCHPRPISDEAIEPEGDAGFVWFCTGCEEPYEEAEDEGEGAGAGGHLLSQPTVPVPSAALIDLREDGRRSSTTNASSVKLVAPIAPTLPPQAVARLPPPFPLPPPLPPQPPRKPKVFDVANWAHRSRIGMEARARRAYLESLRKEHLIALVEMLEEKYTEKVVVDGRKGLEIYPAEGKMEAAKKALEEANKQADEVAAKAAAGKQVMTPRLPGFPSQHSQLPYRGATPSLPDLSAIIQNAAKEVAASLAKSMGAIPNAAADSRSPLAAGKPPVGASNPSAIPRPAPLSAATPSFSSTVSAPPPTAPFPSSLSNTAPSLATLSRGSNPSSALTEALAALASMDFSTLSGSPATTNPFASLLSAIPVGAFGLPNLPHNAPTRTTPPGGRHDDESTLPSYEDMIIEGLMRINDPNGTPPRILFEWMHDTYPLMKNFRPSASQALQKAYKRGRLLKNGALYKINPDWAGGSASRKPTRRPQVGRDHPMIVGGNLGVALMAASPYKTKAELEGARAYHQSLADLTSNRSLKPHTSRPPPPHPSSSSSPSPSRPASTTPAPTAQAPPPPQPPSAPSTPASGPSGQVAPTTTAAPSAPPPPPRPSISAPSSAPAQAAPPPPTSAPLPVPARAAPATKAPPSAVVPPPRPPASVPSSVASARAATTAPAPGAPSSTAAPPPPPHSLANLPAVPDISSLARLLSAAGVPLDAALAEQLVASLPGLGIGPLSSGAPPPGSGSATSATSASTAKAGPSARDSAASRRAAMTAQNRRPPIPPS